MISAPDFHVVVVAPGKGQGIAEASDAGKTIGYTGQQVTLQF